MLENVSIKKFICKFRRIRWCNFKDNNIRLFKDKMMKEEVCNEELGNANVMWIVMPNKINKVVRSGKIY